MGLHAGLGERRNVPQRRRDIDFQRDIHRETAPSPPRDPHRQLRAQSRVRTHALAE